MSLLVSKIFQIHIGCSNEDDCKTEKNSDCIPVEIPSNRRPPLLDIFRGENSHAHGFLFNSEFVSVDDQGRVIVSSVAQLSLKETLVSKFTSTKLFEKFNLPEKDPLHRKVSATALEEKTDGVKDAASTQTVATEKFNLAASRIIVSNAKQQKIFDICERNFGSPDHKVNPEGKSIGESLEVQIRGTPIGSDDRDETFRDMELSPRLTNFINSGFVPESPTNDGLFLFLKPSLIRELCPYFLQHIFCYLESFIFSFAAVFMDKGVQIMVKDLFSTPKISSEQNEKTVDGSSTCGKYNEMSTPIQNIDNSEPRSCKYTSVMVEDKQTPMEKLSGKSCSEDWQLRSADKSDSIGKKRKFRRLLKHGDLPRRKPPDELNTSTSRKAAALCGTSTHTGFKHGRTIGNLSALLFYQKRQHAFLLIHPAFQY